MIYQNIKIVITEGIGVVTFIRPKVLNALNTRFFDEMNYFLDEISMDMSLRVLILTGEGKGFVAGADISEMVNMNSDEGKAFSEYGQMVFDKIENLHCPVIAAVNGFALGGGCELAMACDFRIASEKAKFGQPEVNLGLIPGYAGTQRLSRLAGMGNALYLLTSGEMITAAEAMQYGLVQKVIEPESLMDEVMRIAKTIASKAPDAVKIAKKITRQGYNKTFDEGCNLEAEAFGNCFGTKESKEGMTAFLEKRKPEF